MESQQLTENFLPKVVGSAISGDVINLFLTGNCGVDTVLRIQAVDKAIELTKCHTIKQDSTEEFQKIFEKIYNFYTNNVNQFKQ